MGEPTEYFLMLVATTAKRPPRPSINRPGVGLVENVSKKAVHGENMFKHPRMPETLPEPIAPLLEAELAEEQAFQMKLEDWLARRRQR